MITATYNINLVATYQVNNYDSTMYCTLLGMFINWLLPKITVMAGIFIYEPKRAVEYWKDEKCDCCTCRDRGKRYDYDIADTHQEGSFAHGFFEILDFEKGVAHT